jgi:hypothetical protein
MSADHLVFPPATLLALHVARNHQHLHRCLLRAAGGRPAAPCQRARAAWEGFLLALRSPDSIVFHLLALAASFYHAATWFNATQKAMPIQIGEDFVPGNIISGAHYAAWAVLSVAILFVAGVF